MYMRNWYWLFLSVLPPQRHCIWKCHSIFYPGVGQNITQNIHKESGCKINLANQWPKKTPRVELEATSLPFKGQRHSNVETDAPLWVHVWPNHGTGTVMTMAETKGVTRHWACLPRQALWCVFFLFNVITLTWYTNLIGWTLLVPSFIDKKQRLWMFKDCSKWGGIKRLNPAVAWPQSSALPLRQKSPGPGLLASSMAFCGMPVLTFPPPVW